MAPVNDITEFAEVLQEIYESWNPPLTMLNRLFRELFLTKFRKKYRKSEGWFQFEIRL